MIDRKKFQQAREWAEHAKTLDEISVWPTALAAADVIQSLPDEIIDGDKVREIIEEMAESLAALSVADFAEGHDHATERWRRALEALLPAPTPRTLADMDDGERQACQWMQADYTASGHTERVVISRCYGATADIILTSGSATCVPADRITPLPDLPKLKWPKEDP